MKNKRHEKMLALSIEEGLKQAGFIPSECDAGKRILPMGEDFTLTLEGLWDPCSLREPVWYQTVLAQLFPEHRASEPVMVKRGSLSEIVFPLIDAAQTKEWHREKAQRNHEEMTFSKAISGRSSGHRAQAYEFLAYALKRRLEEPQEGAFPLRVTVGGGALIFIEGGGQTYLVERYRAGLHIRHESSTSADFLCGDQANVSVMEEQIAQYVEGDLVRRKNQEITQKGLILRKTFSDLGYAAHRSHEYELIASRHTYDPFDVRVQLLPDGFHIFQMKRVGVEEVEVWKHDMLPRDCSIEELAEAVVLGIQRLEEMERLGNE